MLKKHAKSARCKTGGLEYQKGNMLQTARIAGGHSLSRTINGQYSQEKTVNKFKEVELN